MSDCVTASTERQCIAEATAIKAAYLAGKPTQKKKKSDLTLRQACDNYIKTYSSRQSPTTPPTYEKIRDNYFQSIMDMPLCKITYKVLDEAIGKECERIGRRGKKLSPKTINNAFYFIIAVLKKNKIRFDEDFKLPEIKRKPVIIPTAEEVYGAVKGSEIELPCLLSMWLTLSMSEIRGLTKSKSINNGQLSIVETVVDVKNEAVRKEGGKEEERTRTMGLPPFLQELIDKVDGDVICLLTPQSLNERLRRLLQKAGVMSVNFHKLRHISASTMAELDIPKTYAQDRGGWKTDYTMDRVYTHVFTRGRREADKKVDDYFESIIGENANTKC